MKVFPWEFISERGLSDISGLSGHAIFGAILAGERDPYKLADLCDCRVQASREEVARSLEGN
jgi:transposase